MVNLATVLAFKQNNLFDFFETEVKKTESLLIDNEQRLPFDQLLLFWLKKERYYHPLNSKAPPAGGLLLEANNYLDNFFLIYKLRLVLETQLRSRVYSKEEVLEIGQLNTTFQLDQHENKLVKTYYNLILLQQGNDLQLINHIEQLILEGLPYFSKEDKAIVILTLINQVSYLYHSGNPQLVQQLLKLFKLGLQENIFLLSGQIKYSTFLNIALTAAAARAFPFLDSFIHDYEKYLSDDVRQETVCLSFAYRYFHDTKYDEALKKLSELSNSQLPEFGFRYRNLEIRCLFEKSNDDIHCLDVVYSKTEAFQKYVDRNRLLSESRKNAYLNFIRITQKLTRILTSKKAITKKKVSSLLEELKDYKSIVSLNWLEEKIKESTQ